jgi:hypothetical protein
MGQKLVQNYIKRQYSKTFSQAWWYIPVVPALGTTGQEDPELACVA